MYFSIKLLIVFETSNGEARKNLQVNCTHVGGDYWLYEGEEFALHDGIKFDVVCEAAIEEHGDLNSIQLKNMVRESFDVDVDGKEIGILAGKVVEHHETCIFAGPEPQDDADEPRYKLQISGAESVVKQLADAIIDVHPWGGSSSI